MGLLFFCFFFFFFLFFGISSSLDDRGVPSWNATHCRLSAHWPALDNLRYRIQRAANCLDTKYPSPFACDGPFHGIDQKVVVAPVA
jgi:hypothetical protein